jgi:hypothetical protein
MRKLALLAGIVILPFCSRPAEAVICTVDAVPAATLLLPYFEVDLVNPSGTQTLFSVNNASATAVLVHVVIWSDLSVPVLDFDVYLTGYDVQTINLRDILVFGNLPQTASAGQDPTDTISPKGALSQDINFASCTGALPLPQLPAIYISHLQNSLTGQPSALLGGNCAGQAFGDNIARGYVTMDTVDQCSTFFPGDAGYFVSGGTGVATNQNVLWGDWIRDMSTSAESGDLVHIEASGTNPATSTPGRYTFYGRYDAWTAVDNREPLATGFAVRYFAGAAGGAALNTSLAVWRDSKVSQGAFTCPATPGVRPAWYPLGQEGIVIFDEQEHAVTPVTVPVSPQPPAAALIPFPAEAQRVHVSQAPGGTGSAGSAGAELAVPFAFGWLYLDLNTTVAAAGSNPPVDPAAAQAFVTAFDEAGSNFAVGIEAIRLDSACAALHFTPGGAS